MSAPHRCTQITHADLVSHSSQAQIRVNLFTSGGFHSSQELLQWQSFAGVAQSVEQLIRNEKVEGSIPFSGTNEINGSVLTRR